MLGLWDLVRQYRSQGLVVAGLLLIVGLGWFTLREAPVVPGANPVEQRPLPVAQVVNPEVTRAVRALEEGKRRLEGAFNASTLYHAQEVERYLAEHEKQYRQPDDDSQADDEASDDEANDGDEAASRQAAVTGRLSRATQPPDDWVRKAWDEGGKYPSTPADLGFTSGGFFPPGSAYEDRMYPESDDAPFRIEAIPVPPGSLHARLCGILSIDQHGNREALGGRLPAAVCWAEPGTLRQAIEQLRE